jgi:hypothetical protein
MGCTDPERAVTPAARATLEALRFADMPDSVSTLAGLPLFRIRAVLRELVAAGLVVFEDSRYKLTATGRAEVDGSSQATDRAR